MDVSLDGGRVDICFDVSVCWWCLIGCMDECVGCCFVGN